MSKLNQAKIVAALEALLAENNKDDFIYDFLLAYGTPKATINRLKMERGQRNVATIEGDTAVPQKIYFRPLEQGASPVLALDAICKLPLLATHKIRFVVVTDFTTVAAYDRKVDDTVIFDYNELHLNYEFFLPLTGKYDKVLEHTEHPADVKACEKMGRLYDTICAFNNYGKDDLHTLNVFLTRLLFCFFAEDTGIFPQKNQMTDALQNLTEDGSDLSDFFSKLFSVLNLPDNAPARKFLSATFKAFPYVNGDLFKEHVVIPQFNPKARRILIECGNMTWSDISPVIFGSMFQEIMDPEKRRERGAHYTSEKNILKVIQPLFLDALNEEFQEILSIKQESKRKEKLKAFRTELGTLGFLDPACGCGNFLIVSYRKLRELELEVLLALRGDEKENKLLLNIDGLSKVNISQFHGIELEEFPTQIARVSMWLTEHVMNVKLGEAFGQVIPSIPLKQSANIVCANALTTPWEEVVAPDKLHYIFGNPPFSGARKMSVSQKASLESVCKGLHGHGDLDFVGAWFYKSAKLMHRHTHIQTAFVATNSICQGGQVALLWQPILNLGNKIDFAYTTFKWTNEARGKAAVFCIVVGFNCISSVKTKKIFSNNGVLVVQNINPYLVSSDTHFIKARSTPICSVPNIGIGNKPIDNGLYLFKEHEKNEFIQKEPTSIKYFKRWIGSKELIRSHKRFCLWLGECSEQELAQMPEVQKRVKAVSEYRLQSVSSGTRKIAARPTRFHVENIFNSTFLAIPEVSSERRKYIPITFFDKDVLVSNKIFALLGGKYEFGILTSLMHMTWMRSIGGRLKNDYSYSASIVYNTFPWPQATPKQQAEIETLAQNVLDVRDYYPDMTLAQMYNPETMPEDLQKAHTELDLAVDALYRKKPFADDAERLQVLFKMYEELVARK